MTAEGGVEPTTIGRYELSSRLGIGGFAAVFRAYDTALDADVAVKILLAQFVDNADIRHRFLQEARLLRRVDSNHLIRVYDIGELADGRPYFVMELAEGGVLSDRLTGRRTALDRATIAAAVEALAGGLGALHEANIVHRDVKPENMLIAGARRSNDTQVGSSLLADGERFVIGDLGLAKDREQTSAGPTVSGGTPFYRAPEQMTPGAPITPTADVYAASGVLWFLLTGAHPPETPSIPAQLPSIPAVWQSLLDRGLQRDPMLRHGTITEWADEARAAIGRAPETGIPTVAMGQATELCPYKGMAAFQPEDAGLFFGRDDLIDTLVARLQHHPVVVIGGPSGSGKSSLMRAGLIPRLGKGAIAGSQQWRVALFNPGSDAVGELVHQLRRLRSEGYPSTGESLSRDDLPHGGRRWLDDGSQTLLVIDQFEELFTLNPSRAEQELFFDTLAVMTESEHSRIRVALALRADFYGACAAFPWLSDRINESQLLVGPMSRRELRDAITVPAQRAGLHLESGLADMILDDVGAGGSAGGGSLPLMGHALMETWIRRRGNQMTIEGYGAAGGVSGAIAQRAEEVFTQLAEPEQAAARRLLLQLINPGQGTPDTRRRVRRSALGPDASLADVLEKLAAARLLTVDDEAVEVAHEALLQSWPRLRQWIDEDREDLQTRRRISGAAAEWDAHGRNPDLLYRGTSLAAALEWLDDHPDDLDPVASEFLVSAREVRDEAERQRLAGEARARRARRLAIGALATLTVAAVAASILAFGLLRRSQANERAAQAQQVQTLAEAAGASASDEPLLATALALESMIRADPALPAARGSLVDARVGLDRNRWLPQPYGRPVPVGDMLSVIMTPDGERFVTGERSGGGGLAFWDRESRRELHRSGPVHGGGVQELAVSADGRWLMSVGESLAFLWDLAAAEPEPILFHQIDPLDGPIWSAAFSPDGSTVALATEKAGVVVLDLAGGRPISTTMSDGAFDLLSVTFLDDQRLVVGDGQGRVSMVDLRTGQVVREPVIAGDDGNDVWELVFDRRSDRLITASTDDTVKTWLIDGDRLVAESTMSDATIDDPVGVVLARDGSELVFGDVDGDLHRSDPTTGGLVEAGTSARLHTSMVIDASASDEGWVVSLGDDQRIQVWRYIGDEAPVDQIVAELDPARDLSLSPSGHRLAVATETGAVIVDAATGEVLQRLVGRSESIVFVSDDRVVAGSNDGLIRLWDASTGQQLLENAGHEGQPIRALAASPDGRFVASGADGGSLVLWSVDGLTVERRLDGHRGDVTGVAFTPDGRSVVSVGFDRQLRVTPIGGGEPRVVELAKDPLSVAVHPDGEVVAYGSGAESVEIIDFDGNVLHSMAPHGGGAWDLAFTVDGLSVVATGREDGRIQLWDWATEEQLGPPFGGDEAADGRSALRQPAVVVGPGAVVWWAGQDGLVHRLDVLDERVGCAVSRGVLNQQLRDRFLDGADLMSCPALGG